MPGIFICYRRDDASGHAGRLHDHLSRHFEGHTVFMDVDGIQPGEDFVEAINQQVGSCDALLAVIGRHWLTLAGPGGGRRIDDPNDFVRLEIAAALARNIRVIPVLVAGAQMPRADDLPEDLKLFSRRIAVELSDTAFRDTLPRLIRALESALRPAVIVPPASTPRLAGEQRKNDVDGLTYVWIPPGKFVMGCSPGDKECVPDESPAHEVEITKGFWMGQTAVTQRAWEKVMKEANPSHSKGADRPVESVTWEEAKAYCEAVGMRLPTEAEWEYAARAGSTGARYGELDEVAWYAGNSGMETHPVGAKKANPWGLYDMLGNVWEWTADWYGAYEQGASKDPQGPSIGQERVVRGGSWYNYSQYVRASYRSRNGPTDRVNLIGFRCAGEFR